MIYIITALLLLGALAFLLYPFFTGAGKNIEAPWNEEGKEKELRDEKEQLHDRIESAKLALRDLDMENKIGKISPGDFEILKEELLEEWSQAKHAYEAAQKETNPPAGKNEK